jgi:uncharacterized protein (DUF433 family)
MTIAPIQHIALDKRGVAYVAGTRVKVRHIAINSSVWNLGPEAMREAFPHLTPSQIYAALAFYFDNKETIDREIAESEEQAENRRQGYPNPLTRDQLDTRRAHRQA